MLSSYEALYDHGQVTWVGEKPDWERARVIITAFGGVPEQLPRKELNDAEIEQVVQESCGAWGQMSLEECDAWIRQRRLEDWGQEALEI
ncbi:MAG: hypothetical protein HQL91_10195 [Magnetococcales bacterium]|nr:hypothetical protein [Magnetococcales bacterium]